MKVDDAKANPLRLHAIKTRARWELVSLAMIDHRVPVSDDLYKTRKKAVLLRSGGCSQETVGPTVL